MEIQTKYFGILPENDKLYFAQLKGVIESVDEYSSMEIINKPKSYDFRISTSHPKYINLVIEELIKYHNLLNIKLNFSKSIKTTSKISFSINKFV